MTSSTFIGIDLATIFSAIAYINEYGIPEIIENAEGEQTTPSVVLFDGDDLIIGTYAKENATAYPGQMVEKDAEEKLGECIEDVVITVPAYFGDPQRKASIVHPQMPD